MAREWYALRVVSGQETKISKLMLKMVENGELSECIIDTYIPMHDVTVVRAGKQHIQKRRLVPGYILIQIDMPAGWKDIVSEVRSVDGVIGFASVTSAGDKPHFLSEEEVRHMLNYRQEGGSISAIHSADQFSIGEMVHIKAGPLKSFRGKVEEVDEKRLMLKVTVEIFGRVTPIEISHNEVEKI